MSAGYIQSINRWRENMTPVQHEEWKRRVREGHARRKARLVRAQADNGTLPTGGVTSPSKIAAPHGRSGVAIALQQRLNGEYIKQSSRTLFIANAPWDVDDLLRKLEKFADTLCRRAAQPAHVRTSTTRVIDAAAYVGK